MEAVITIKMLSYKRKILQTRKIEELEPIVNRLGKDFPESLQFNFVTAEVRGGQQYILISSPFFKEEKWTRMYRLKAGYNPFRLTPNLEALASRINAIGSSQPEEYRYRFVSVAPLKFTNRCRFPSVVIQKINSEEIITVTIHKLLYNKNPFCPTVDYDEKNNIHPKFKKMLERLPGTLQSEVKLPEGCRLDFVYTCPAGLNFVIEVKSDIKKWTEKEIKDQMVRYEKVSKMFFGNSFGGIYLASELGKYGDSIKSLKKKLLKKGMINE